MAETDIPVSLTINEIFGSHSVLILHCHRLPVCRTVDMLRSHRSDLIDERGHANLRSVVTFSVQLLLVIQPHRRSLFIIPCHARCSPPPPLEVGMSFSWNRMAFICFQSNLSNVYFQLLWKPMAVMIQPKMATDTSTINQRKRPDCANQWSEVIPLIRTRIA